MDNKIIDLVTSWDNQCIKGTNKDVFKIIDRAIPELRDVEQIKVNSKKTKLKSKVSDFNTVNALFSICFKLFHFPEQSNKLIEGVISDINKRLKNYDVTSQINESKLNKLSHNLKKVQYKITNEEEINNDDVKSLNVFYLLGKYKDRIERLSCEKLDYIVNPRISRRLVSDINNLITNFPNDSFLNEYQHVIVNPYFGTGITPFAKGDFILDNTLYNIDFDRKNDYSKEKARILTGYVLFHIIQQEYVHKDNKHYREDMAQLQYIDKFVIYNPRVNTLLICQLPPYGVLFNAAIELKLYYEEQLRRFKGLY